MSIADKLSQERRARLAAERLLELKQAELFAANRKLGRHAQQLTHEITETRAEVATVRSENKRVKSDLTAANQKIQLVERRLWQSIQTIQDGFAIFDDNNALIEANPAYLAIFEDLEEVQTGITYPRILQLLTEEGIVNTGDVAPADWRTQMIKRWHSADPQPVVIRFWNEQYIKVIDRRGRDGDVASLALNITSTVRYEERLRKAHRDAEAANRAKSAFLANMSHEIRTPMNGVVGMAELLHETVLSTDQQLYVETIKNSGQALLVIINDVLDYSKIEADRLELSPEPFDLESSVHEIVMLLQSSAREKGIELLIDYDMFSPTRFVGDPGRIRQVLTNLIGNAVKFTTSGHVLTRIVGEPLASGDYSVHVAVEDTGIGIAEEKLEHVFGEFNQVEDDRNRQFEGTGLGLAISKRLIQLMQGDCWVTSEPNEGSCFGFRITLPLVDAPETQAVERNSSGPVLVIEPAGTNRDILVKQLGSLGFEACCIEDIAELGAAPQKFDLIVVDSQMVANDDSQIFQTLFAEYPHVPLIICASDFSNVVGYVDGSSNASVLQKPVQRSVLKQEIDKLNTPMMSFESRRLHPGSTEPPVPVQAMPMDRLYKVLLAEDNATNQLVFRKMIASRENDIELTFANNGLEAVAAYKADRPDVIFMDISMPKMDGKEATQKIREMDPTAHVPIIAVTAHALDGDRQGILAAGLDDYLTKPLRKADLLAKLDQYLSGPDLMKRPLP